MGSFCTKYECINYTAKYEFQFPITSWEGSDGFYSKVKISDTIYVTFQGIDKDELENEIKKYIDQYIDNQLKE